MACTPDAGEEDGNRRDGLLLRFDNEVDVDSICITSWSSLEEEPILSDPTLSAAGFALDATSFLAGLTSTD